MRYIAVATATILFALAGTAQQQPDATQSSTDFRIEGTVVDAETGQPVENARLEAGLGRYCCNVPESATSSGADGSFRIALKSGGWYTYLVRRDGYVTDLSQVVKQCTPCTVAVRLHKEAKFRGRVVAADTKEPISRVMVEAIRVSDLGAVNSIPAARDASDRNGEFTLTQLTPGQYFFRFTPPAVAASFILADADEPAMRQFVRQWWPGGDAHRNATPFTVLAGTDFRLPDVWIPAVSRFQVSGTIQAATCQAGDAYTVSIGEQTSGKTFRSMLVRCGAQFVFPDLTPGRYQISLFPKGESEAVAREEVVVADRNLQKNLGTTRTVR